MFCLVDGYIIIHVSQWLLRRLYKMLLVMQLSVQTYLPLVFRRDADIHCTY